MPFFSGKLHEELIECGQRPVIDSNEDKEAIMKEIEHERVTSLYPHTQGVSCKDKGIYYLGFPVHIRESVDSLCRDGADMPISLNIKNPSKFLNADILSLYRHLTLVLERFCAPKYP